MPAEAIDWSAWSKSGAAVLEQRRGSQVVVDCRLANAARASWSLPGPLAGADDLRFVAEDCTRAVFVYPVPTKQESWAKSVIIRLVEEGHVVREVLVGQLPDFTEERRPRWLGGVLGEKGERPRYSEDGAAVMLQVLSKSALLPQLIPLAREEQAPDSGTPKARASAAGPVRLAPDALYSWTDKTGATQVATGAQIPAYARASAVPVGGDVQFVAGSAQEPRIEPERAARQPELAPQSAVPVPPAQKSQQQLRLEYDAIQNLDWQVGGIDKHYVVPKPTPGFTPGGGSCKTAGEPCTYPPECCSNSCSASTFKCI